MKISYISASDTWNDQQVVAEARKRNDFKFEKINLEDLNDPDIYDKLGDVILWRSSSLEPRSGRTTLLSGLLKKGKMVVNRSIVEYPAVIFKQFQQEFIRLNTGKIKTIPTFTFSTVEGLLRAVESGSLKFPFIRKPNLGAKGRGVKLITDQKSLNLFIKQSSLEKIQKSVWQNFIPNGGDYRVLVVGGRPIGAIKRMGKKGSFLNNVSQGGQALPVEDERLKMEMFKIASQVSAVFNLGFCGVDIIQDKHTKELFFLELNTVPQWEGFQKATGINVARELLDYCFELGQRKKKSTLELVKTSYLKQRDFLANRRWHFLTRMFLWTREDIYHQELLSIKEKYYGVEEGGWAEKIKDILTRKEVYQKRIFNQKKFRQKAAEKYPSLGAISEILFRNLMSKNIFGIDLRPVIKQYISDEELLKIREGLLAKEEYLRSLSTFAVNYLYFLEGYFAGELEVVVPVEKLVGIVKTAFQEKNRDPKIIMNDIYFVTHMIIGATRFYYQKVPEKHMDLYGEILEILESTIDNHYIKVSLDTKLELLICAKMLGKNSFLEKRILDEAELSLSPMGNYLVDTFNVKKRVGVKSWLGSEHRNVLYIIWHLNWNC